MTDDDEPKAAFPPPRKVDPAAFYDVSEGAREDPKTLLGSSGFVRIEESLKPKESDS